MAEFSIQGDVVIAGSRILVPTTIASILPGVAMPVSGTVAPQPGTSYYLTASGPVKSSAGVLYAANVAGLGTQGGTLLLLNGAATIAIVPVPAGGFVSASFGPGVAFTVLGGSIVGPLGAGFVVA